MSGQRHEVDDVWGGLVESALVERLCAGSEVVGRIEGLRRLIGAVPARRALVVLDRVATDAAGLTASVFRQLSGLDHWAIFEAFSANPRCEQAQAAADQAARMQAEVIVGIGGGSCLDVAKVASLGASTPSLAGPLSRGEQIDRARPLPLIAAPTTSGTGSDATHFAAIYVNGRKVSVAHPQLRPRGVVLDVRLHEAMPASLAASSGLDALGQAMESLWAVHADELSIRCAKRAGRLIADHLEASVHGGKRADRRAMMIAARLAGEAINRSKTTAAHALSYQLTEQFGLAHGHAVALTLGQLARANAQIRSHDCNDRRGAEDVRRRVVEAAGFLGVSPEQMPARIRRLLQTLGLPCDLREAGLDEAHCHRLAKQVDAVRLSNNPRRLDADHLARIMIRSLGPGSPQITPGLMPTPAHAPAGSPNR